MIVYFIVTQYSIDINYTYLKKIHDTINQLGHKPSRKWLSKERRFIESINQSIVKMALIGACLQRRTWRLSEGQTWSWQKLPMKI